jgi:hypothetical protein
VKKAEPDSSQKRMSKRRRKITTASIETDKNYRTNISVDTNAPSSMILNISKKINKDNNDIISTKQLRDMSVGANSAKKNTAGSKRESMVASPNHRKQSSNSLYWLYLYS